MTIRMKLLAAAAVISLPAAGATAQVTGPADPEAPPIENPVPGTTLDQVNEAVQDAQDPIENTTQPAPEPDVSNQSEVGPVTPATETDVTAGATVRDTSGGLVGTIESVGPAGAVIATGTVRAQLPISSFGRSEQGLVIAMTKIELEAAAQRAAPTPS